jgi:hypothetical protein
MRIQKSRGLPTWLSIHLFLVFGGVLWLKGPGGNPPAVEEALMRRRHQQQQLEREREAVRKLEASMKEWK